MRRRFTSENCSVARSLEVLGDWWTLLLIREAFLGTRRFADFEANLKISKNILTARLAHLVRHKVLERVDAGRHGRRFEYQLTPMGKDLIAVVTALRQWGDRWIFGKGREPLLVRDTEGQPLAPMRLQSASGREVRGSDLVLLPGPGASKATLARFRARLAQPR